jgi:hypothetical protein
MAWAAKVTSERLTTDANFEAFTTSGAVEVITLNPRELLDINVSIASVVGEVDDLEVQVLAGQRITNGNALLGTPTTTALQLAVADDPGSDDYYLGMYFLMTTGGEIADLREITDFVSSTDIVTLGRALSAAPAATETYAIFHMRPVAQFIITAEVTATEDLPQNGGTTISGYPFVIVRARATGATDAHVALMTYTKDGVSA